MKPTSIEEEEVPEQEVPATKGPAGTAEESSAEATDEELIGSEFSADLFTKNVIRTRPSKSKSRAERRRHARKEQELDVGSKELQQLQEEDESLAATRKAARGEANSMAAHGFFRQDGLIYRLWTLPG